MSPSSTQQWTRRIRYADQHIRVSDADRNAVAEQLGVHYADGRLDQAEFDERSTQAMNAKTRADLSGLFSDLPETPKPTPNTLPDVRQHRHRHPFLGIVVLFIVAIAVAHAVATVTLPLLWIAFVALAVLFVIRGARHNHTHHHRSHANQEQ